ncbi:MAG: AMP-binding protein, partial [Arenicellales bacterium]
MTIVPGSAITDPVSVDAPGTRQIAFDRARHANCSEILWQNLERNPNAIAITGPSGAVTYKELIQSASRWGNALKDFGLKRGERVILFLDDTPLYPAVFFGAVRAGFVP